MTLFRTTYDGDCPNCGRVIKKGEQMGVLDYERLCATCYRAEQKALDDQVREHRQQQQD